MAETPTHHDERTRLAAEHPPTRRVTDDEESARSSGTGGVSLASGILGVLAGVLPGTGLAAFFFGAVAFAAGIPSMKAGPSAPGYRYARIGTVLALVAIVLGVVDLVVRVVS